MHLNSGSTGQDDETRSRVQTRLNNLASSNPRAHALWRLQVAHSMNYLQSNTGPFSQQQNAGYNTNTPIYSFTFTSHDVNIATNNVRAFAADQTPSLLV